VVTSYDDHQAVWDAWHIKDANQGHDHAEFTDLDTAIAWGKVRCERVRLP
jgi:hypothetical protein